MFSSATDRQRVSGRCQDMSAGRTPRTNVARGSLNHALRLRWNMAHALGRARHREPHRSGPFNAPPETSQ